MGVAATYQVAFLGREDERAARIKDILAARLGDLGMDAGAIAFLNEGDIDARNRQLPIIGVFLGYPGAADAQHPAIAPLLGDSNIVVTVVSDVTQVAAEIPPSLQHVNAIPASLPNHNFDRIGSVILEGFRLLRRERRLFISYKRSDSQSVADQLYDALDARGFDVFIDTRAVPPAVDFQAELWHRLLDTDVVVLIDTPGFRASRWTTEELAHANATSIQILHLLWPDQKEDGTSAFSRFYRLDARHFEAAPVLGGTSRLTKGAVEDLCNSAESLRAGAIAARHRYLMDGFCGVAVDHGLTPVVQPQRWISVTIPDARALAVMPTIGVPTSGRINDLFQAVTDPANRYGCLWALYDSRGMLKAYEKHLIWLNQYLPVKLVSMVGAYKQLKDLLELKALL